MFTPKEDITSPCGRARRSSTLRPPSIPEVGNNKMVYRAKSTEHVVPIDASRKNGRLRR